MGFVSEDGFTVLKDSTVSYEVVPSFPEHQPGYYNLRINFENNGVIFSGTFQSDYEFSSPSAASSVILGRSSNGPVDWKDENGKILRDLIEE